MSEEIRKWLDDIMRAIQNIDIHLSGKRNFVAYQANITVRRAVEQELEIIGEATNRILKLESTIAISNARRIVDLRNRVIHAYNAVDDVIVWGVVIKNLPALKQEVEQALLEE